MHTLPKVVLVGGPDIDARLELMHCIGNDFDISVLGSRSDLNEKFLAEGFGYSSYHLRRMVSPLADLLTLAELVFIFRKSKPKIVHTFDTKPNIWGCLAARLAGVPIVIGTMNGLGSLYASDMLVTGLIRMVYQLMQRLASRFSDVTIFQNQEDIRQFIAAGVVPKEKAIVIPGSGVATDVFTPSEISEIEQVRLRRELGIQHDEIVVVMISRVIRSKGVLEFAAAAEDVGASYPDVNFLLIGPSDEETVDRLSARELAQLKRALTWPGPREDIATILSLCNIFVFPSAHREGIPRVLLEAASMGLPIVTTDSPGCNDVVENGVNGFLVPARDQKALATAIVRLIEQPELRRRFGRISRRRAVEQFDISNVADQMQAVYRGLLAREAPLSAAEFREESNVKGIRS